MKGQQWRGTKNEGVDELALLFSAGRDVLSRDPVDKVLIPFDLWNTEAHNIMLWKRRIVTKSDIRIILQAIRDLRSLWEKGEFELQVELEDVHMNVESRLIEMTGASVGGRIHTGRSRNDQVACDMRMYQRAQLLEQSSAIAALVEALLETARANLKTVMPGFTHRRPATVTSLGHWLMAHAQAMTRDLERIRFTYDLVNRCPLGAAASYGTSWNLDRDLSARLLGFDSVEENTLDCIVNRWEHEAATASAFVFFANHAASLSQDLIFFSLHCNRWIDLPEQFTTGSSIMPQKRNPDFAEIILGKAAVAQGSLHTLLEIGRGLPGGYNRETQLCKHTLVDLLEDIRAIPQVLDRSIRNLKVNKIRLAEAAAEGYLNAVDLADYLVREHKVSFREAYGAVARAIKRSKGSWQITLNAFRSEMKALGIEANLSASDYKKLCSSEANLEARTHLGAPAPQAVRANIERIKKQLSLHSDWIDEKNTRLAQARQEIEQIRQSL